jgi:HD superfamily phosphohydrolase
MIERAFAGDQKHEAITMQMITDPGSEIFKILTRHGVQPSDVGDLITKTSEHRLIIDMVSSQLDADRMDYLLRDSLMTGVEYGYYDCEWMLNNLCIGRDPNAGKELRETDWRLCLDRDRGLHSAEQLVISRMHMTLQVYLHRVTRSYEVLLLNLFKIAAKLAAEKALPESTPSVVVQYFTQNGKLNHAEWLRFDESVILVAFHVWAESPQGDLSRLAKAFLNREKVYKGVLLKGLEVAKQWQLAKELSGAFQQGLHWELDDGQLLPYKGVVYAASKPKEDPEERSAESILLSSGAVDETAQAMETVSDILKTLDFNTQNVSRLYYDRALSDKIEPVLLKFGVKV